MRFDHSDIQQLWCQNPGSLAISTSKFEHYIFVLFNRLTRFWQNDRPISELSRCYGLILMARWLGQREYV
jgi:hypothetical protein